MYMCMQMASIFSTIFNIFSTFCQHWPNTATDIIVYVKTEFMFEVSEYTKAYRKLNILTF